MKRHLNTLFQRKRLEFDGPVDQRAQGRATADAMVVHVKDGYDWLSLIKQSEAQLTPSH